MLQLKNLELSHQPLLEAVNLIVEDSECVTLSGASGSGKSMLLRAIADLDEHAGEVFLNDREQHSFSGPQWRKQVAYVTAENHWWHDTIGQHFADPFDETLLDAIDKLALDKKLLESKVNQCSTGERQRFSLLRTIQNHPATLLLDEPTASLDPDAVTRVEKFVLDYMHQRKAAVLWVSHDATQRERVSQRQYNIENSRLVEARS